MSTIEVGGASCCSGIGVRSEPQAASSPPRADARATAPRPSRIIRLPAGRARIGVDDSPLPQDGEGPSRLERLRAFSIDPHAVTNAWFAAFVDATGHKTDAERHGWSAVFAPFVSDDASALLSSQGAAWWRRVEGACWRRPEGPQSDIATRKNHPVVHVSWSDATAFAAWAGGRLPTEAEWEYAAKGGLEHARFPWGDEEPDDADFQPCNIWQGQFPAHNTRADGHVGTAPVDAFAPNGYGLFNMAGNTWEWCADAFRVRSLSRVAKARNEASRIAGDRVLKGGSYLCHRSYCYRYRIAARSGVSADSSTGHVGFRVVFDD